MGGLDDPDVFRHEMTQAGFDAVEITSVRHTFPVGEPRRFWEHMVRGSAPITFMKKQTAPGEWVKREAVAVDWLQDNLPAGTTRLH